MALALDVLSAHSTLHLLGKEDLLLMEVGGCVMNVEVLEMIVLVNARPFSREEFLLIQMS